MAVRAKVANLLAESGNSTLYRALSNLVPNHHDYAQDNLPNTVTLKLANPSLALRCGRPYGSCRQPLLGQRHAKTAWYPSGVLTGPGAVWVARSEHGALNTGELILILYGGQRSVLHGELEVNGGESLHRSLRLFRVLPSGLPSGTEVGGLLHGNLRHFWCILNFCG